MIDAHQHFWALARGDYGWLTADLEPLYRDFEPGDLAPHLARAGVEGTILVQAAPTRDETEFLLGLAEKTPFVQGVVGWVDFQDAGAAAAVSALAARSKLVGLRPMIQDIADDDWMLRAGHGAVFEAMAAHGLVFDALVLPRHLPNLLTLLNRHPDLRVVIDHGAKPGIATGAFDDWAGDMARIAEGTAAYCKLSGLVTEAGEAWTPARLAPYISHLIRTFGPERLIWGSDWPVLTLASDYQTWLDLALSHFPGEDDRRAVFGGNARKVYGF